MTDEIRLLRKEVSELKGQQTESAARRLDLGMATTPQTSTSTEATELEARTDTPISTNVDEEIDLELLNDVDKKVKQNVWPTIYTRLAEHKRPRLHRRKDTALWERTMPEMISKTLNTAAIVKIG